MLSKKQIKLIVEQANKGDRVIYPFLKLSANDIFDLENKYNLRVRFVEYSGEGLFSDTMNITCPEISRKENA